MAHRFLFAIAIGQLNTKGVLSGAPAHEGLASELMIGSKVRPLILFLVIRFELFVLQDLGSKTLEDLHRLFQILDIYRPVQRPYWFLELHRLYLPNPLHFLPDQPILLDNLFRIFNQQVAIVIFVHVVEFLFLSFFHLPDIGCVKVIGEFELVNFSPT